MPLTAMRANAKVPAAWEKHFEGRSVSHGAGAQMRRKQSLQETRENPQVMPQIEIYFGHSFDRTKPAECWLNFE